MNQLDTIFHWKHCINKVIGILDYCLFYPKKISSYLYKKTLLQKQYVLWYGLIFNIIIVYYDYEDNNFLIDIT